MGIQLFRVEIERFDQIPLGAFPGIHSVGGPFIFIGGLGFKMIWEFHRLHHLPDQTVA